MYFIKEFVVLVFVTLLIEGRHRFESRIETRKSLSRNDQKNFDHTANGLQLINKLQRRIMGLKNKTDSDGDSSEELPETSSEELSESPMGNPNLFQGDIVLTENQVDELVSDIVKQAEEKKIDISDIGDKEEILKRKKRSVDINMTYKWTFPIPYYVDSGVNAGFVTTALKGLESETCVRFTKSETPIVGRSGLRYYYGNGCWSNIGRIYANAPQEVSIGSGCGWNGIIQHETAHALGLHHEQNRPDRDSYVLINTENIKPGSESNFARRSPSTVTTFGVPYDYGSGMHYSRFMFSKNGNPTLTVLERKYERTVGQSKHLSFNDFKLINFKYCNSTCVTKITCQNGGYQNPNDCTSCKCPLGFTGTTCQSFTKSLSAACGQQQLTATTTSQTIKSTGFLNCYYYINAPANRKVQLNIETTNIMNHNPCYSGKGLEIKYKKDKTVTGANYCGVYTNEVITSESNSILIHFVGSLSSDTFTLTYKIV